MMIKRLLAYLLVIFCTSVQIQAQESRIIAHDVHEVSLGNGKFGLHAGRVVGYKTITNEWDWIDLTIQGYTERDTYGNRYGINKDEIRRSFPDSSNGLFYYGRPIKGEWRYFVNDFWRVGRIDTTDKSHTLMPVPNVVPIEINGDTVSYKNIYNGVDLRFINLPNKVKQEFEITQDARASIPGTDADYLALLYRVFATNMYASANGDTSLFNVTKKIGRHNLRMFTGNSEVFRILNEHAYPKNEDTLKTDLKTATFKVGDTRIIGQGMPLRILRDTVNYKGAFIIDPSYQYNVGSSIADVSPYGTGVATLVAAGKDDNIKIGQGTNKYGFITSLNHSAWGLIDQQIITLVAESLYNHTICDAGNVIKIRPIGNLAISQSDSSYWNEGDLTGEQTDKTCWTVVYAPTSLAWVTVPYDTFSCTGSHDSTMGAIANPAWWVLNLTAMYNWIANSDSTYQGHAIITTTGTGNYPQFYSSDYTTDASKAHRVYVEYTKVFPVTPYSISTGNPGSGEIRVIFSDSNNIDRHIKLLSDGLVVKDSMYTLAGTTVTDTLHWTGLPVNTAKDFYLSIVTDVDSLVSALNSGTSGDVTAASAETHGIVPRVSGGGGVGRVQ